MIQSRTRAAIEAQGLALFHPGATAPVIAGFDLSVAAGEIVAVLGPSGVGKSSLLRVLAGLEAAHDGALAVDGVELDGVNPRVALAFQDPSLLPWLTVEKNVAFGLDFKRQPTISPDQRQARVDAAINEVELGHARTLHPAALSGGMAQRTALARCLVRKPSVLLLDEPFGALDEVTRADMQQLLLRVVADSGAAAVFVTHDIDEALIVADRIILLGGAPARVAAEWRIDAPHPRDEADEDLNTRRVEILAALRRTVRRPEPILA